jgi:putative lipoprotein
VQKNANNRSIAITLSVQTIKGLIMKRVFTHSIAAIVLANMALPVFAGTVTGTAFYRERIALPPDAVFEVSLQDVSRADAAASIIGSASYTSAGTMPFAFTLHYDDKVILPGHNYAVRATIRHQGKLLFTTDTHVPAFASKEAITLKLVHVARHAAANTNTTTSPLRNTYWKLTELNKQGVEVAERQREPHIIFAAEQPRLSGSGGCNSIMGGFDVAGTALTFKQMAGTMMACPNGMEQETVFLRTLTTVASYKIDGDTLILSNADNAVVARFKAVALK